MVRVPRPQKVLSGALLAGGAVGLALAFGAAALAQQPPGPAGVAQQETGAPPEHSLAASAGRQPSVLPYSGTDALLKAPVSGLYPGGVSTRAEIKNPVRNDPAAVEMGMRYFTSFNCVGCHAANGGGGIGPALSNRYFKYGSSPANIYLSIVQGRPDGMPAWGALLLDDVVWDLVAYIEQISKAPRPEWGTTTSLSTLTTQQVPSEFLTTTDPWAHTEPFTYGQKPTGGSKPAGPGE